MNNRALDLQNIIKDNGLNISYYPKKDEPIKVTRSDISRAGLQLAGFFDYFEPQRIQIIGHAEFVFLLKMEAEKRALAIDNFLSRKPIAVLFTHGNKATDEILAAAEKYEIPILWSDERTSTCTSALIAYLNLNLAPTITRHGVLVEVYGEGVLIIGNSGVGKSETAIELIKRGHRLVADDAVEISRVSAITLVGKAPSNIKHYIELRGIGVVDVCRLFGMGSVKESEKIDMIVNLEAWEDGKSYSRIGVETEYTDILGISVPTVTIPVKPGRNLAIILEIAAMEYKQKRLGYNTAEEFNKKIMESAGLSDML